MGYLEEKQVGCVLRADKNARLPAVQFDKVDCALMLFLFDVVSVGVFKLGNSFGVLRLGR